MTSGIIIEVAGEAVGKGRPRATRTGRMYTPAKTVRAEARVGYAAQQAMAGRTPLDGAVKLTVTVDVLVPASWSKRRRFEALEGRIRPTVRPDADNVAKLVADSLNGIVYGDDRQIADLAVTKVYAAAARMVITIEPLSRAVAMSAVIRDEVKAAARALAKHKDLDWHRISPWWQQEQRAQVRAVLAAAAAARTSGYRFDGETDEVDLFGEGGRP